MNKLRRHAFTLIELLVVIAILGLLVTIVAVQLRATLQRARLNAARTVIEQVFVQARFEAVTHHETRLLEFDATNGRLRIVEPARPEGSRPWRSLDGVQIRSVEVEPRPQNPTEAVGAIRVTPAGVTLPWMIELFTGDVGSRLRCDGLTTKLSDEGAKQ